VLYRREDGMPVALEDRCCHRQLPLSMGRLEGDDLRCGYHGLKFDASGKCIEIPGQTSIPPQARVRAYPLIEKYSWVWIWMGGPASADPALIPNWWWTEHPEWAFTRPDMVHLRCNYQLISDNVLDVTHLAYVHASSIGASSISEFPATVERDGRLVRLTRWIVDRPPPPLYKKAGGFPGNADRWQIVEHVPPCFTVNFAGCKDEKRKIDLMALSAPTPETERSTHYFFGFVRNFGLGDAETDEVFSVDMVRVSTRTSLSWKRSSACSSSRPMRHESTSRSTPRRSPRAGCCRR
jgi:phenylpropionate dioxygenase-like ring-hydroxylating dioxygenase large terminal subunit